MELCDSPVLPTGAKWRHGANGDNDDMDRLEYQPATDPLYLSGFTTDKALIYRWPPN